MNNFNNDKEKIKELKTTLEEALHILETKGENGAGITRTLIKDVLSRYKENKKFITANVITKSINGIEIEILKD